MSILNCLRCSCCDWLRTNRKGGLVGLIWSLLCCRQASLILIPPCFSSKWTSGCVSDWSASDGKWKVWNRPGLDLMWRSLSCGLPSGSLLLYIGSSLYYLGITSSSSSLLCEAPAGSSNLQGFMSDLCDYYEWFVLHFQDFHTLLSVIVDVPCEDTTVKARCD